MSQEWYPDPRREVVPVKLSKMPLRAPWWVWVLYVVLVVGACVLSADFYPLIVAAFSFQFWTFACWLGMRKRQREVLKG